VDPEVLAVPRQQLRLPIDHGESRKIIVDVEVYGSRTIL
jgi:hypothetical protein